MDDLYRRVFEQTNLGLYQSTLEGQFLMVNPALARMLGYDSPDDVLASITDVSRQVYRNPERRTEVLRQLEAQGGTIRFEDELLTREGHTRFVTVSMEIVPHPNGAPSHLEGFVEDITERKQVKRTPQRSEDHNGNGHHAAMPLPRVPRIREDSPLGARHGCTLSQADVGLLHTPAHRASLTIQDAGTQARLKVTAEPTEDSIVKGVAHPREQVVQLSSILPTVKDGLVLVSHEGDILDLNQVAEGLVLVSHKGEILERNQVAAAWLDYGLFPSDVADLLSAIVSLAARAAEHPECVLALTELNLRLSAASVDVPVREEKLAVILIQDVTGLRAVDRMKSRFISQISQKLRSSLAVIRSYLDLLDRRKDDWLNYRVILNQAVDDQCTLVEQILELSDLDSGQFPLERRPTDLNAFTLRLLQSYERSAASRGIELVHRPADSRVFTAIDPERMTRVVDHLLRNAQQYTFDGGLIVVSIHQEEAVGSQWAVMCVVDTGVGIPDHEIPHVFTRYFRGESARALGIPGTGLGLAVVEEIVKLHGGRVQVDSRVGSGSTFAVWLPAI